MSSYTISKLGPFFETQCTILVNNRHLADVSVVVDYFLRDIIHYSKHRTKSFQLLLLRNLVYVQRTRDLLATAKVIVTL